MCYIIIMLGSNHNIHMRHISELFPFYAHRPTIYFVGEVRNTNTADNICNSLCADQGRQKVGPDQNPNCCSKLNLKSQLNIFQTYRAYL